jgi:hypothetical protein
MGTPAAGTRSIRFTLPWGQSVGVWAAFVVGVTVGSFSVNVVLDWWYGSESDPPITMGAILIGAALGAAVWLPFRVAAFTAADAAGIRWRGGLSTRHVPWSEVRALRLEGGTRPRVVRVVTGRGAFRLPAPVRGEWPWVDPDFEAKVDLLLALQTRARR